MKILNFQRIKNFEKEFLKHMNFVKSSLNNIFKKMQGFLGITCHFITPDFEMKEITLAIRYMPYPHTGDAI